MKTPVACILGGLLALSAGATLAAPIRIEAGSSPRATPPAPASCAVARSNPGAVQVDCVAQPDSKTCAAAQVVTLAHAPTARAKAINVVEAQPACRPASQAEAEPPVKVRIDTRGLSYDVRVHGGR